MTDIKKIREYLVGMANAACCNKQTAKDIKEIIIPHIDSLQKEQVSEDLEEAAMNYMKTENPPIWGLHDGFIAGAKWREEHPQEKPASEDLEEATNNYCLNARKGYPRVKDETDRYICSAFKAGAQWQKEQFEKDYANLCKGIATAKGLAVTMAYDKGMADAREQMMKDAYDAYVSYIRDNSEAVVYLKNTSITMPSHFPKKDLEEGDKLKIVIIKED